MAYLTNAAPAPPCRSTACPDAPTATRLLKAQRVLLPPRHPLSQQRYRRLQSPDSDAELELRSTGSESNESGLDRPRCSSSASSSGSPGSAVDRTCSFPFPAIPLPPTLTRIRGHLPLQTPPLPLPPQAYDVWPASKFSPPMILRSLDINRPRRSPSRFSTPRPPSSRPLRRRRRGTAPRPPGVLEVSLPVALQGSEDDGSAVPFEPVPFPDGSLPDANPNAHAAHEPRRHRRARARRAREILQSVLPWARIHRIRGRGRAGGGRGGQGGNAEREGSDDTGCEGGVAVGWVGAGDGGDDCTGDGGGDGGEEDKGASASGNRGEDGSAPDPAYAAFGVVMRWYDIAWTMAGGSLGFWHLDFEQCPKFDRLLALRQHKAAVRGDVRARAQVVRDPFFPVVVLISVRRRRIGHVSLPPSASAYSLSLSSAYGGDDYDASRSRRSPARLRCSCTRPRARPGLPHSVSPLTAALAVVVRVCTPPHRMRVRVRPDGLQACKVQWGAEERKTRRPVPFHVRHGRRARPPSRGDAAKKARSCTLIQDLDGYHTEPQSAAYPESESSVRGGAGAFPARGSRPKVDSGKKCRVRTAEDREDVDSHWASRDECCGAGRPTRGCERKDEVQLLPTRARFAFEWPLVVHADPDGARQRVVRRRNSRSTRTALRPAPLSRGIEHGRGRYGRRRQELDFGVGAAKEAAPDLIGDQPEIAVTEIVQRADNSQQLSLTMGQSYELNDRTTCKQRVDNSQQPSLTMAQSYELNVKSIKGVDPKYGKARLCVAIHVDGKWVHNTHPKEASVAMWNDTTTLDSTRWADNSSSIIGLRIYDRHNWRHYVPLMNEKYVDVPLKYVKSKAMPGPTLVLRVSTIGNIQAGELEIANAKADIAPLESGAAGFAALQVAGTVQSSDFMLVLGTLLESILKIGDEFAKVAWTALHSVYKVSDGWT
ncbi:hypothetical protein B0H14DRAFT_3152471 [Mycena olivaceomarginata]|nr:hypothetical protein B0H14DRAFT_3152471 [Mycena olivaceomarginata]